MKTRALLVLDECDQPVKDGECGELCVLGARLAHGYYNDPEKDRASLCAKSAEHRVPREDVPHGRYRALHEGTASCLFCGRADTLIKHLGYRIELSEVEHVINSLGIVSYACAVYNCEAQEITLFYEAETEIPVPHDCACRSVRCCRAT